MPWIKLSAEEIRRRRNRQIVVGVILAIGAAAAIAGPPPRDNTAQAQPAARVVPPVVPHPDAVPSDDRAALRLEWWHRQMDEAKSSGLFQPFFRCSYTNEVCLRGWRWPSRGGTIYHVVEIFELIDAQDRTTVIERGYCEITRSMASCRYVYSGRFVENEVEHPGEWR